MPTFFNTAKNGYNPDEVDRYIQNLENIINSYKEKDEAISNAIVNAQIAADNIIKNSEMAAKEMRKTAVSQLDMLSDTIDEQRQTIVEFQRDYGIFIEKYVKTVNEKDFKDMINRIDEMDKYFQRLKQEKPETNKKPNEAEKKNS